VEVGSAKVPIDTSNISEIKVNIGNAADTLSNAIRTALDQTIKVETSTTSVNAIGGEKFDTLAQMVSTVKDQLIQVKRDLEEKITMVGSNNQTSDIDRQVAAIVDSKLSNINQDISGLRNNVGDLMSSMRLKEVLYDHKFSDLDYRLSNAMNITGIGGGGGYRI